ncbi:MAG: DUF2975 domain-containing protein [Xanthomonadales bacterium]|nr:DUF2975 domain-containing protein [Xanthomonadales bacterium]
MNITDKITLSSRWFAFTCLLLLIMLPFYLIHHWVLPPEAWLDGMPFGFGRDRLDVWPPSLDKQTLGLIITFIPGYFIAQVLNNLRKLFGIYAERIFFSTTIIHLYNKIASASLRFVIAWILAQTAMSIAMSYNTDSAYMTLTFTHTHATALFAALVLRFIAWIMQVALQLEKENQSFV